MKTDEFLKASSWPFQEARKLQERLEKKENFKGYALFETGYGPSGLPHIGTFAEVFRTTLVRRAFECISDIPTRLVCFSDDMDALRKVPDNVPNQEMLREYIGYPLTSIPDPYGKYESFAHHNNAMLRSFVEGYGFDCEFKSATAEYKSGRFDQGLRRVLNNYEEIMGIMLPTLGSERRETYSPIMPISPVTGKVLMTGLEGIDKQAGTIRFRDEDGKVRETEVTGGKCKLQWKVDWAMRWAAQDVDYEMSGNDLLPTVRLSEQICRTLGGTPPNTLNYALFVDENNQKISKSKGNGISIETWLKYATPESLAHFLYQKPTAVKSLHKGTIGVASREYMDNLARFAGQSPQQQVDNPVWHIHAGKPPAPIAGLTPDLIINVAGVLNTEDPQLLVNQISKLKGNEVSAHPMFNALVQKGVHYYLDHMRPTLAWRQPDQTEAKALTQVANQLAAMPDRLGDEEYQNVFYAVGKEHYGKEKLRDWFKGTYQVVFGHENGPRMGGFVNLYGRQNTVELIRRAVKGDLVKPAV